MGLLSVLVDEAKASATSLFIKGALAVMVGLFLAMWGLTENLSPPVILTILIASIAAVLTIVTLLDHWRRRGVLSLKTAGSVLAGGVAVLTLLGVDAAQGIWDGHQRLKTMETALKTAEDANLDLRIENGNLKREVARLKERNVSGEQRKAIANELGAFMRDGANIFASCQIGDTDDATVKRITKEARDWRELVERSLQKASLGGYVDRFKAQGSKAYRGIGRGISNALIEPCDRIEDGINVLKEVLSELALP